MESTGVLKLYSRSVEKNRLCYIPFIGDGDSSAYSSICVQQPYGPTVYIPKEDCISHVTKRMGTNLRALIRDYKGIPFILSYKIRQIKETTLIFSSQFKRKIRAIAFCDGSVDHLQYTQYIELGGRIYISGAL